MVPLTDGERVQIEGAILRAIYPFICGHGRMHGSVMSANAAESGLRRVRNGYRTSAHLGGRNAAREPDRTRGPERTGHRLAAAVRQRSPSISPMAQNPHRIGTPVCPRCSRHPHAYQIHPADTAGPQLRGADPAAWRRPVLPTLRRARLVVNRERGCTGCARARSSGRVAFTTPARSKQ
jgi:hypothetical protein